MISRRCSVPVRKLNDDHHLLRHVPARLLRKHPDTNEVIGVFADAFRPRPDEKGLSASWLEHFQDPTDRMEKAIDDLGAQRELAPKDRIATGRVADVADAFVAEGVRPRIVHDGKGYPSHAVVRQIDKAPDAAFERLARSAWSTLSAPSPQSIKRSKEAAQKRRAASRGKAD
jgi:hypothetical protein